MSKHSDIAINQSLETISRPFFYQNRALTNTNPRQAQSQEDTTIHIPKTSGPKIDNKLTVNFPIRNPRDFVKQHAGGSKNRYNSDIFQHVFRILIKNQYYLRKNFEEEKTRSALGNESASNQSSLSKSLAEDDSVEYIPIETKEFVLERNIDQFTVMDKLAALYEDKYKVQLNGYFDDVNYQSTDQITEEYGRENFIVERVLNKINEEGLQALNLADMVAFKCKYMISNVSNSL